MKGESVDLESIVQFCDELLGIPDFPDDARAQNGLQVEGTRPIRKVGAAVDASVQTIEAAVDHGADLLIVHHGLYWAGLKPLTERRYRRVAPLIRAGVALYSAHLPLDGHREIGNASLLASAMGLTVEGGFGSFQGSEIGVSATAETTRESLRRALATSVDGPARLIPGGPDDVRKIAVATGSGSSFLQEAADAGCDSLVTGEAPHHSYLDAMEMGMNLLLGGHYATETFGVRALARKVAERFGVETDFLHFPTGI